MTKASSPQREWSKTSQRGLEDRPPPVRVKKTQRKLLLSFKIREVTVRVTEDLNLLPAPRIKALQ